VRRFRFLALLLALAMVAAACGRSDDDKSSGGETTTTTASSGGGGAKSADFGTLTDVCQSGKPTGSPAQGVTPTSIKLATFSDPGFAGRPGLNQELFDTADVFAAWCNDRGGIDGRKIEVDKKDAALTQVQAKMTEACANDFMMVGGGAVFDQDGVETRLKCLMPDIAGYAVSPENRGSDLLVQPVPNSVKEIPIGDLNWLEGQFPKGEKKYGVLTGDIATTRIVGDQYDEAAKALGWQQVYKDVYPATGASDWTPYAEAMRSAGVEGLIWVGEPENLAKLVVAMNNIGYTPKFIRTDANHYDEKLIDQAGAALKDNVYVRSIFQPFENVKKGSATDQYLQAFKDYKPDGKNRTYLGLQAWSAWLLFAQAAKECGNDLTRKCVYDNAKKVSSWTGGGLHAETDPKSGGAQECFALEKATPNGFVLAPIKPNDGIFRCDGAKAVYQLKKPGQGITLQDVGLSMADFK
jgi:ABC-type branched-subunit amino acid transport system substrate-binding protein